MASSALPVETNSVASFPTSNEPTLSEIPNMDAGLIVKPRSAASSLNPNATAVPALNGRFRCCQKDDSESEHNQTCYCSSSTD